MGNSHQISAAIPGDEPEIRFTRVSDIPIGTSPPSVSEVQEKVTSLSCLFSQKYDPLEIRKCRECLVINKKDEVHKQLHNQDAEKIRTDLAMFRLEDPAFTEKTYQFKKMSAPEIWISSTKNSDQTISYWLQYPILPFHIQAAM
jgi:hypothetical protein